jgi:ABC-type lipoprotein release transport system permease subunit
LLTVEGVGAAWPRARALLRANAAATVALALLAGLASGVAIGAWSAARRGEDAYDRFVERAAQPDLLVYVCPFGVPPGTIVTCGIREVDDVRELPEVAAAARVVASPVRYELPDGSTLDGGLEVVADGGFPTPQGTPTVADGRLLDPAADDEVLLPEGVDAEVPTGSTITITPLRISDDGLEPITRLRHELRVVGKARYPSSLAARVGVLDQEPETPVVGPGWWRTYGGQVDSWGTSIEVRAADGVDAEELRAAVETRLGDRVFGSEPAPNVEQESVDEAIGYETAATGAFAVAVGLAALVFVGQALTRQARREAVDLPTLRALGAGRGHVVGAATLRGLPLAVGAVLVAVGTAHAASAFSPFGLARRAEIDRGLRIDAVALAVGGALVGLAVLACLVVPSTLARSTRRASTRRSVALRPGHGLPVSATAGANVLLRPAASSDLPLRAAAVSVAVAVGAAVAGLALVASLSRLVDRPDVYGVTWDLEVQSGTEALDPAVVQELRTHPAVAAAAHRPWLDVLAGGAFTPLLAFDPIAGDPLTEWGVITEGREPLRPGEAALGAATLARLGARIGDTVELEETTGEAHSLQVVGRAVFNTTANEADEGALVTSAWLRSAVPDATGEAVVRLADDADDADRADLVRALERREALVRAPVRQTSIRNLQRIEALPWVLVVVIAVLAATALLHALLTVTRLRRSQLALLRAVGLTRWQVGSSVVSAAALLTFVAVVVGVPLGLALGRWGWSLLADDVGVVSSPVVPLVGVAALAAAGLALAAALAVGPAWRAARTGVSGALRAE